MHLVFFPCRSGPSTTSFCLSITFTAAISFVFNTDPAKVGELEDYVADLEALLRRAQ